MSDPGRPSSGGPRCVVDPADVDAVVFAGDVLVTADGAGDGRAVAAPSAIDLLRSLRGAGVRTATATARRDAASLLAAAGLDELVVVQADGVDVEGAPGTPEDAVLGEALARLAVPPARALLVGRRPAELAAARSAGFGRVLGVLSPSGLLGPSGALGPSGLLGPADGAPDGAAELLEGGADEVVAGLAAIEVADPSPWAGGDHRPDPWSLVFEGFDPADEARREVLCASGNGYLATRGAAPESTAGGAHYPGTYLAGVYNRLVSDVHGRVLEHEELVNGPNWLPFTFRAGGGPWFGTESWQMVEQRQRIDIRYGVLHRRARVRDGEGRVTLVTQRRLVSMDDPHLAALETVLVAENWSGDVEVRTGIDGDVTNSGVESYRQLAGRHLSVHHTDVAGPETVVLVAETVQSGVRIAVAERVRALPGTAVAGRAVEQAPDRVDQHLTLHLRRGRAVRVEKVVGVYTSRDRAISECSLAAVAAARRAGAFDQLAAGHRAAWERLWARSALWVDADGRTPTVVNLHRLHLLQSVSPHTAHLDAGVTARGLHGEAYRGHVFWDELFVFPLFTFRLPELTRSLLQYRYRRLGEARRLAREAGHRGAMFPWQSAMTGREETPTQLFNPRSGRWIPDHSHRQRHVGLAIAYNTWSYYQATGDVESLVHFGAELMIEIARFWASVATWDPSRHRYDIRGVMGPDEFHDGPAGDPGAGLVNNAYTNVMAAWALWRTRQVVDMLAGRGGGRVFERLDLRPEELAHWEHVGTRLSVPFDREGRIAQFEGYDALLELDWDAYRDRYGDIGRLDLILETEGDTPNRYKLAKQADVLMLFFMLTAEELGAVLDRLGYPFDPATIPETVRYYLDRTSNGSTLSRVAHAWVLARSDRRAAWQVLLDALGADVDDGPGGTTGEGVHLGAMAGTVDLLQRCFVDLDARDDVLHLNPRLPDELPRLRCSLDYRGHRLELDVTHAAVVVRARPGTAAPVRVAVRDHAFDLAGGDVHRVRIDHA